MLLFNVKHMMIHMDYLCIQVVDMTISELFREILLMELNFQKL